MKKAIALFLVLVATAATVSAWTGPTQTAPNGNVSAPINVGAVDQVKNSGLSVNSLAVFGNAILSGTSRYLNFGTTAGTSGYGVRDNAGTMEFKNSGGSWSSFNGIGTQWTTSGSNIYYAAGMVGVGAAPSYPLHVTGTNAADYMAVVTNTGTHGIMGQATTYGVVGYASATGGKGVMGQNTADGGTGYLGSGVHGVQGSATCGTSACYGVFGSSGSYYGTLGRADGYSFVGSGTLYNNGNVQALGYFHLSDANAKKNIKTISGLEIVQKLRGVTFDWKKDDVSSAGVIAQEVEKVMPTAVGVDESGAKTVDYDQLIAPMIEAIKEQQQEINSLRHEIEILKALK